MLDTRVVVLFHWELLEHLPYSLGLTQSYYHLFGPLKQNFTDHRFHNNEEMKIALHNWL